MTTFSFTFFFCIVFSEDVEYTKSTPGEYCKRAQEIQTSYECRMAAISLGISWDSQINEENKPKGCVSSIFSGDVTFNASPRPLPDQDAGYTSICRVKKGMKLK